MTLLDAEIIFVCMFDGRARLMVGKDHYRADIACQRAHLQLYVRLGHRPPNQFP